GGREPEPVHARHLAPGDRDEAREPRLRGQEIVAPFVERSVGDSIAGGEGPAGLVEQECEIHPVEELARGVRHLVETLQQALGGSRRLLERLECRRKKAAVEGAAGELACRRARELRQIAERGRGVEQTRDGARRLPPVRGKGSAARAARSSSTGARDSDASASRRRASAASMPRWISTPTIGRRTRSRAATARTLRWPARLPLSTEDT